MVPSAATDIKHRTMSLESCVAVLLVGCATFALWALSAPIILSVVGGAIVGALAAVQWVMGRYGRGGDGDWWFMAGAYAALATVDVAAPILAMIVCGAAIILYSAAICVRRPGLPFPRRLYLHVKRKGDTFRIDVDSGGIADADSSGMVVRPALPMIPFLVVAVLAVGIVMSL